MRLKAKFIDSNDFVTESAVADGIADTLTLTETPIGTNALWVYRNGIALTITQDYTLTGLDIEFVSIPAVASELMVKYLKR